MGLEIITSSLTLSLPKFIGEKIIIRTMKEYLHRMISMQLSRIGSDFEERLSKSKLDFRWEMLRHLRNLIFAYIPQDDFCVILDHFECVTPKINGFLTALYETALVVIAGRQSWELSDYGFTGRLDYSPYLVPKLRIENPKRKNAFVLMESLCCNVPIAVPSKQEMFDEVFCISRGNPGVVSTIFEKARSPEYRKDNRLNLKLILIDSRIEEIA